MVCRFTYARPEMEEIEDFIPSISNAPSFSKLAAYIICKDKDFILISHIYA